MSNLNSEQKALILEAITLVNEDLYTYKNEEELKTKRKGLGSLIDRITIAPNPNDGNFTVNFDNVVNNVRLEVFTVIGQKLAAEAVNNVDQKTISLNQLATGTYLLKISSKEESVTKRIIIK